MGKRDGEVEMKIQEILKQPEGKMLEFKKEIPKNRQNLLKTMVAFANGAGAIFMLVWMMIAL